MILTPALLHLFGRQYNVASVAQLGEHLSSRQLKRANDLRLLEPILPTVRRLAGAPDDAPTRLMALSLYAGTTGFVSGLTAARRTVST